MRNGPKRVYGMVHDIYILANSKKRTTAKKTAYQAKKLEAREGCIFRLNAYVHLIIIAEVIPRLRTLCEYRDLQYDCIGRNNNNNKKTQIYAFRSSSAFVHRTHRIIIKSPEIIQISKRVTSYVDKSLFILEFSQFFFAAAGAAAFIVVFLHLPSYIYALDSRNCEFLHIHRRKYINFIDHIKNTYWLLFTDFWFVILCVVPPFQNAAEWNYQTSERRIN